MKHDTCKWTEDEDGSWNTGCGNKFEVVNGLPSENGFKYCLYCGKSFIEIRYVEPETQE